MTQQAVMMTKQFVMVMQQAQCLAPAPHQRGTMSKQSVQLSQQATLMTQQLALVMQEAKLMMQCLAPAPHQQGTMSKLSELKPHHLVQLSHLVLVSQQTTLVLQ